MHIFTVGYLKKNQFDINRNNLLEINLALLVWMSTNAKKSAEMKELYQICVMFFLITHYFDFQLLENRNLCLRFGWRWRHHFSACECYSCCFEYVSKAAHERSLNVVWKFEVEGHKNRIFHFLMKCYLMLC